MERRNQRKRQQTPHLSCELCRKRKVKCDKLDPCTNCVSSGVVCAPVHRPRLPRGVYAQRARATSPAVSVSASPVRMDALPTVTGATMDEDLKVRLNKLEALVNSMRSSTSPPDKSSQQLDHPPSSNGVTKQAPLVRDPDNFWADLAGEVQELRGAIGSTLDQIECKSAPPPPNATRVDIGDGGLRVLVGLSGLTNLGLGWTPIFEKKEMARQLCQVYLQHVDPIIKILHRPSVERWMLHGERYLGLPERHPAGDALGSAICYAAAMSLTETQSLAHFHTSKSSIVTGARRACEAALEKSGLLVSPKLTTLQAFVLYLVARRSEDRSRAPWTLTAVAVRVAKALGLCEDADDTFFNQQMRKRLWQTVCLMDLQASFSQASEPLISAEDVTASFRPPRHINDSDFGPTTAHDIPDREGLTDTTFAIVSYHVQLVGRLLNFGGGAKTAATEPLDGDRESRQLRSQQFEQEALRLLHFVNPESTPYAWFTWHGTQCFVSGARLSALHPLQRSRRANQMAPSTHPNGGTELLRLTVNVLEKALLMHTDPRGEGFRWYVTIPWHALAIAVAECYVCQDMALVRRAWPIIEMSYQNHEAVVSADNCEAIHGPLERLMGRTREKLAPLLGTSSATRPTSGVASVATPASHSPPSRSGTALSDSLSSLSGSAAKTQLGSDLAPLAAVPMSTSLPKLDPLLSFGDDHSLLTAQLRSVDTDQSWRTWDALMAETYQDGSVGTDMFLSNYI
ncbi:hypothetical protein CNMCM8927_003502 [Aspergillus lentulus]|uniref:Zn(2)-C6 fungal-type domain-containing protein n=1 Tax=Aspergillus lentulus TaxID=293939 RepID=A0AAN6BJV1_ASPLE|nr:hypothetical protein CNMCM8927_003502 [Aspergillus lentulus]